MTDEQRIQPLRFDFEVRCAAEHAFDTWTRRIGQWWPADHTVIGRPDAHVTLEGRLGGRIFERTPEGEEHDWGEVTLWEPPSRLGYLWHLRADRADATEVEIRFTDIGPGRSRVEIEHRGWERLGDRGQPRRDANRGGWETLLPHFRTATAGG